MIYKGLSDSATENMPICWKHTKMSSVCLENLSWWFPIRTDTNQTVYPQEIARGLEFQIQKEEGMYYLCSQNRGADLRLCFRICKTGFLVTQLKGDLFWVFDQSRVYLAQVMKK